MSRLSRAQSRVAKRLAVWSMREDRFALARLLLAVVLVMVLVGFYRKMDASQVFLGWLGFFVVFFSLSAVHRKLKRIRARFEGLAGVFAAESHRLERDWNALRQIRSRFSLSLWQQQDDQSKEHPYKSDFDLSGLPSLWLDTCTLEEGSGRLKHELLVRGQSPLTVDELASRRKKIEELAVQSKALRRWESYRFGDWSGELLKVADDERTDVETTDSAADETLSPVARRNLLEAVLWLCVLVQLGVWTGLFLPNLLSFVDSADTLQLSRPLSIFIPILLVSAAFWEAWRRRVQMSSGSLGLRELKVLNALEDVDKCLPAAARKQSLVPVAAGRRFRFLRLTFELGEVRRNPIVWLLLNAIVPYDAITFAVTLMAHRALDGRFHDWWNDVVAFDFDCSLARVKLENPEFTQAAFADDGVAATQICHPLIPFHQRIGNDLQLDSQQRCVLLTGSNMAGKSTLLRAIGFNALLAQMGCVVCAEQMSLPRVEILCAIQVSDSLESGASYFYAEVRRLAMVLSRLKNADEGQRKLFLIDEIFRGTNNRERFLGSWQVISALLRTGAFGVLTTHDLALTSLENEVAGVRNFHLRETVGERGTLEFDYLLRPGPCPTTNALIIMQQAGLPVELDFKPGTHEGGNLHV
ncbi:MAG: MutS-related protein [Silvanigrellaceae bacterium]